MRAGEILGLIGSNGAGKTTTLKLLLGLLRPTSGSAKILGLDCTRESRFVKERVGYTPDEPKFYDFMSGRETLELVIGIRRLDRARAWAALEEALARLDFTAQLDALVASYSHGMKKKLALLCAQVHAPPVLLLDEPTNGLDPPTALRVRELLGVHAQGGGCTILSTHLLDMAETLCDRLLLLHRGRAIATGNAQQLRAQAGLHADASLEQTFTSLVERWKS